MAMSVVLLSLVAVVGCAVLIAVIVLAVWAIANDRKNRA